MAIIRKYNLATDEGAKRAIRELTERVEKLEKIVRSVYHTQTKMSRGIGSSFHDVNTSITDANRKITQVSKK